MTPRFRTLAATLPVLLLAVGSAFALQDTAKPKREASDASARKDDPSAMKMEMPKPTKEHEWLKSRVGTWDCTMDCPMMGGPSKGTETAKMFGDFWLVTEFSGSMNGQSFKGMGQMTYDPMKQKFVMSCIDTMSPMQWRMEGTLDAAKKTLTCTGTNPTPDGKLVEMTCVLEQKSPDEWRMTMYETSKGPSDAMASKGEFKRRK